MFKKIKTLFSNEKSDSTIQSPEDLESNLDKQQDIHRFNVRKEKDAIRLLVLQMERWLRAGDKQKILLVAEPNQDIRDLEDVLRSRRISFKKITTDSISQISPAEAHEVACIIAHGFTPKRLNRLGLALISSMPLQSIPFEFSIIPQNAYEVLHRHDWQKSASFVSPLLISDIDFFGIYESSLSIFERKCQIRDYMDLCQLLQMTIEREIEGDIAEFGSYKGHSGYLLAQIMNQLDTDKIIYMFDMFDEFPEESVGMDTFWNKTHHVQYEDVLNIFQSFQNVKLVKGDFTETFQQTDIEKLCLIYIDCDSYRGTKYLLETLYDKHLDKGGILILEDYGHGPLLGNRIAFHDFFDHRKDCFKFFSQFSGFQIIVKN